MSFTAAIAGLVHLLAPLRCPGCDEPLSLEIGEPFCAACAPLIEPATGALGTHAGFVYGGPLADALRRYKYGARAELAAPLAALALPLVRERHAGRIDVVVPVPPHPRRLRERGFDPVALLAAPLARALGARYVPRAIVRARDTPPQASLGRNERARNVAGCFAVRAALDEARVLVVDDVRTTGATLFEMAQAVDDAGASSIALFALAVADPEDRAGAARLR
ncbi:MAG: ComF family protein [Sandaracinus sp.]